MQIVDKLNHLSGYTSKLLRRKFGRGPESCQAFVNKRYLVLYIRGFISPMEEVLLTQDKADYVDKGRSVVIKHVLDELKGVVHSLFDIEVHEYYQDWNYPNNTGMIILVLVDELQGIESTFPAPFNVSRLESEVSRVSELVEKLPEQVIAVPISDHVILVIRNGILVPIEKALVLKGYSDELIVTKDELEKAYFHRDANFEEVFQKNVIDIFIDWNLKKDKSFIGFVLK